MAKMGNSVEKQPEDAEPNPPGDGAYGDTAYDQKASSYCKSAIVLWCIVGWIYAAATWHLFWLPGILIFLPGIFAAALIAAIFFIPFWVAMRKDSRDWRKLGRKRNGLVLFAMLVKLVGFLVFIVAPIAYVKLLHHFLN